MSIEEMIALVKVPTTSTQQLIDMMGRDVSIDRLLAAHPKASAEMLEQLSISQDQAVVEAVSLHPNITTEALENVLYPCATVFFNNPRVLTLFAQSPSLWRLVEEETLICQDCPELLWRQCIRDCVRRDLLLALMLNPAVPVEVKELIPDLIHDRAVAELQECAEGMELVGSRKVLDAMSKMSLPYALPEYLEQDACVASQRIGDMLGGFPYTSQRHPWPEGSNGMSMQPIVQIDLELASRLLGVSFGDALLQLWADVLPEGWGSYLGWPCNTWLEDVPTLKLRLIPKADLSDASDGYYPEHAPWKVPENDLVEGDDYPFLIRLTKRRLQKPRIRWFYSGRMFTGSHWHVRFLRDLGVEPSEELDTFFYDSFPEAIVTTPQSELTYMGGFGGAWGRQSQPFPLKFKDGSEARLLFNTVSSGVYFNQVIVAIVFKIDSDRKAIFDVVFYRNT